MERKYMNINLVQLSKNWSERILAGPFLPINTSNTSNTYKQINPDTPNKNYP